MATYKATITVEVREDFGEFQALELKVVEATRQAGKELLRQIFEGYENWKLKKRAIQKRDRRFKKYETLLGIVEFARWRAWDVFRQKCVYPLDEWLGLKEYQKVSPGLAGKIVDHCVELPYSKATKVTNQLAGVKRRPMSNWKLVQGEAKRRQKLKTIPVEWKKRSLPELLPGSPDPCPILSVDPDATYVRPRRKTDKKHEMKAAVIYTGKEKRGRKKKRTILRGKQVILGPVNGTPEEFFNQITDKAVKDYGLHTESRVVQHSDGDPWLKQFKNDYCPQTLNRLDPYHVFKKMREATGLEEIPADWIKDFYKNPSHLIKKIEALQQEMAESKDREEIGKLAGYLRNNKEGMEPSKVSRSIKKKYEGMYLRGSGPTESNIFSGICQRFKGPRMMWSESGLINLSFLRQQHLNKSFDFKKVEVPKEHYRETTFLDEVREIARDL